MSSFLAYHTEKPPFASFAQTLLSGAHRTQSWHSILGRGSRRFRFSMGFPWGAVASEGLDKRLSKKVMKRNDLKRETSYIHFFNEVSRVCSSSFAEAN